MQAYSPPAFHDSACAPRVLLVSIRLMKSDGAILITVELLGPPPKKVGCVYYSELVLTLICVIKGDNTDIVGSSKSYS
jgi:hypothetical protein